MSHGGVGWLDHLGGVLLAVVMTWSWWSARRSGCGCEGDQGFETGSCSVDSESDRLEFDIEGMSCSHCQSSVDQAVRAVPGVEDCTVFLKEGRMSVVGAPELTELIMASVTELGYKVQARSTCCE